MSELAEGLGGPEPRLKTTVFAAVFGAVIGAVVTTALLFGRAIRRRVASKVRSGG
jgi:hypothetical protein